MYEEPKEVQSIFEPEPPSPEVRLEAEKASLRTSALWEIGLGSLVILLHLAAFAYLTLFQADVSDGLDEPLSWKLLFRSVFFILGFMALASGLLGLYRSKHLTIDEIIPSPVAVEFLQKAEAVTPYFTYVLIAGLAAVVLTQLATGLDASVISAGFVKPDFVEKREYWRLLTGSVMHAGIIHIYFNGMAFLGFGSLIEKLSNRAHLSLVFLLASLCGGLLSLLFMPFGTTVGASGGIMGFVGYLAIFGYRRKHQLPATFLKSMLINVAFIGIMGVIGYQFIDNFSHLGGLLAGAIYGYFQISKDSTADVRQVGIVVTGLGYVAVAAFIGTCLFTLLKLTGQQTLY